MDICIRKHWYASSAFHLQRCFLFLSLHFVMQMKNVAPKARLNFCGRKGQKKLSGNSQNCQTVSEPRQTFLPSFFYLSIQYIYLWGLSLTRKSLTAHTEIRDFEPPIKPRGRRRYALVRSARGETSEWDTPNLFAFSLISGFFFADHQLIPFIQNLSSWKYKKFPEICYLFTRNFSLGKFTSTK